jgi:hypothetical protein
LNPGRSSHSRISPPHFLQVIACPVRALGPFERPNAASEALERHIASTCPFDPIRTKQELGVNGASARARFALAYKRPSGARRYKSGRLSDYIRPMCGRFTRNYTWEQIQALYRLTAPAAIPNFQPDYNVCPTDPADVVVANDGGNELIKIRWGLVPYWWSKSLKELRLATFNARVETVTTKPFFREPFKKKRCLMPVSGYYECWRRSLPALLPFVPCGSAFHGSCWVDGFF